MRTFALVALLAASICWGQEPVSNPQPLPVPAQAPAPAQKQTLTIPAGTRIPLSLASQVSTKSRAGDAVRAVTGFPVTVETQLAIPVGTYVEGVIDKVTKGGRSGPSLQMHFTRILFANGYSVSIKGAITQAEVIRPTSGSLELSASADEAVPTIAFAAPSSAAPTLQPLPTHTGAIVGIAIAGAASGIVALILMAHHNGAGNGVLFDTGWQFEMVLESPLTLDVASFGAANSSAQ